MAKRRPSEDFEIPFVALMDTMTNVVGVLIIVLVLVGLGVAAAVKKILSDLPPVEPQTLAELKKVIEEEPPPPDPQKLEEESSKAEIQLKKVIEELKTLDLTPEKQKLVDVENLQEQIAERKKDRDARKAIIDELLAQLDKLKARLDQTPVYTPVPASIVRLPNPRPYPAEPKETRIIVAKEGVLIFNEPEYLSPIIDGLDKSRSQIEYKDAKLEHFAAMLEKALGSKAEAQKAWPQLSPLVGKFQLEPAALAWKELAAGGIEPTNDLLARLADIAIVLRKTHPEVAAAVAAAAKNDLTKWIAMDPTKDPTKPVIKATPAGGKITFTYGSNTEEVRATPREIADYFRKLGNTDTFKNASKEKVIYDAYRMIEVLKRAAANQVISQAFTMEPRIRPGSSSVQLALTPRPGSGQSAEQLRQPNSAYIRSLRNIQSDPHGVAVYQILPEAIPTYLEARRVADEVGVPATWEFLGSIDLVVNVTGFEVQRFAPATARRPAAADAVTIAPPTKTLD